MSHKQRHNQNSNIHYHLYFTTTVTISVCHQWSLSFWNPILIRAAGHSRQRISAPGLTYKALKNTQVIFKKWFLKVKMFRQCPLWTLLLTHSKTTHINHLIQPVTVYRIISIYFVSCMRPFVSFAFPFSGSLA